MDESKQKELRNHLSHVKGFLSTFLSCIGVRTKEETEKDYLLELIDQMETLLQDTKDILNN